MEAVCERENPKEALRRVKANKGSASVDGMTVGGITDYLKQHWPAIREQSLNEAYKPRPVRRVEIPKPDGGVRKLGKTPRGRRKALIELAVRPVVRPRLASNTAGSRLGPWYLANAKGLSVGLSIPTLNRSALIRWSTSNGVTSRTAVYGPVNRVVWERSAGNRYPQCRSTGRDKGKRFRGLSGSCRFRSRQGQDDRASAAGVGARPTARFRIPQSVRESRPRPPADPKPRNSCPFWHRAESPGHDPSPAYTDA
jgi:hypothetical protein